VQRVIVLAIVELLFDAPADLKVEIRCHRHVAGVEEAVQVTAE
jgi:hypothetical protein